MKVIHPTGIRVVTLSGVAFVLEAGVERELPDHLGVFALGKGAQKVGESEPAELIPEAAPIPTAVIPHEATPLVLPTDHERLTKIMRDLINQAQPDSFRADGTPKVALVNRLFGAPVSEEARSKAWEEAMKV